MWSLMVFCCLSAVVVTCNRVTSPQIRSKRDVSLYPYIRILDVATKASETRLIPRHPMKFRSYYNPYGDRLNQYEEKESPLKSYVIYDDYPFRIFKEWKGAEFPETGPASYFQNGQEFHPPNPTLAYRSVYSNIIKVYDDSENGFQDDRFRPLDYEPVYPQEVGRPLLKQRLPENFPNVFSPNENFRFSFDDPPNPPRFPHSQEGYYDTHTVNYQNNRHKDEVEVIPDITKNQKRILLCGFIRLNKKQFPESGPCGRNEDSPLRLPEYPNYSNLPNDQIPPEHRRQHFQSKRMKRASSEAKVRHKRGTGFGYSNWGSPLSYDSGYDGYFNDYYPTRSNYGSYNSNYNSKYYRNRNQGYRNRYGSRSNYEDYEDDFQNNGDDSPKGLTSYLTNGGRRYKNRKNNDEEEDDDDNENNNNNNNNRDEDSDEEMERQNSNRRDNDRRNNDRDRRRNNNNNSSNNNNNNNDDDDDYRSNRRNNNRGNNNRRNNNSRRYYNDKYDHNRNRYDNNGYYGSSYGSGNSYGSNGYGNGGYSSNGYGSGGYSSNGYGSGGYGSSGSFGGGGYGYNGGYGGFSSF